jgi:hypothetical protein
MSLNPTRIVEGVIVALIAAAIGAVIVRAWKAST